VRGADWQIGPVETIPMPERPDTAFRKLALTDSGLMMIDDLGIAEGLDLHCNEPREDPSETQSEGRR